MTRPERVLVSGGRGFVGSHVVRALVASGRKVAVLSRTPDRPLGLPDHTADVPIISASAPDRSTLRRRLEEWQPEGCVHLAWPAEPGRYLESADNLTSLDGTIALLQVLMDIGCPSVVMAGTCAEYDTDAGWLKEDTPLRPRTLYAAAKASASLVVEQLSKGSVTTVAWGRIFYPYGPFEDRRRAVPSLILSLIEGRRFAASAGDQIRDYVHVSDVADAFVAMLDRRAAGAFNVSSGVPITIRSLMETIGDLMGRRDLIDFGAAPHRAWEPRFICGDNSRLRGLDWTPKYTLSRGVDETIAWWRAQR